MKEHRHFMMYKPYGYISQFSGSHKRKKYLGELYQFPEGTMAIGRLDEDSEGLLLLSTSGIMSERIRSSHTEKEYYVQVDGVINQQALQQLQQGVEIGIEGKKYITRPCVARILDTLPPFPERSKKVRDDRHGPTCWISITLNEGKFRQVRKMTAAVGFPTLRLIRIRVGNIFLAGLTGVTEFTVTGEGQIVIP